MPQGEICYAGLASPAGFDEEMYDLGDGAAALPRLAKVLPMLVRLRTFARAPPPRKFDAGPPLVPGSSSSILIFPSNL